jgi:hypothetical protein
VQLEVVDLADLSDRRFLGFVVVVERRGDARKDTSQQSDKNKRSDEAAHLDPFLCGGFQAAECIRRL